MRGGYGWRWPYEPVPFIRGLPLILVTAFFLLVAGWMLHQTQRALPVLLWGCHWHGDDFAGSGLRSRGGCAFCVVRSDCLWLDNRATLGRRPTLTGGMANGGSGRGVMERLGGHIATSPPGLPMGYGLLNDLLGVSPGLSQSLQSPLFAYQCHNYNLLDYTPAQWASAWFGILMPLWAGLTVFPLYAVAQRVTGGDARIVAGWWALLPGVAGFAASWSTFYPLVSVTAFWLLLVGLEQWIRHAMPLRGVAWVIAAGLCVGMGLFLHFTFVPLLGLLGFYTLGYFLAGRTRQPTSLLQHGKHLLVIGSAFGFGLIMPWVIFWFLSGETIVDLLQTSLDHHLDLDRPYWFWVGMHVWDWMLWSGIGLALLWLIGLWRSLSCFVKGSVNDSGKADKAGLVPTYHNGSVEMAYMPSANILNLSLLLTILIMTTSGTTRGESGRIWLFMSPFLLIAALAALQQLTKNESVGAVRELPLLNNKHILSFTWFTLAITIGQAVLMVALTANLAVIGSEFTRPTPPPTQSVTYAPLDARYSTSDQGDVFRLVGWSGAVEDEAIALSLQWGRYHADGQTLLDGGISGGGQMVRRPNRPCGNREKSMARRRGILRPVGRQANWLKIVFCCRCRKIPLQAIGGSVWPPSVMKLNPKATWKSPCPMAAPDVQIGLGPVR